MNDNQVNAIETFEELTTEHQIASGEIIIGTLCSVDPLGLPLIDFPQNPSKQPISAMTTLSLTQHHVTRQVALLFNQGDLKQPIVIGLIHSPLQAMLENFEAQNETEKVELAGDLNIDNVKVEGKKVTFEAQEEMVFKCGESSITLTKSGKVLIRGKYLLNRSSGVNRIMGGSVQVN
ncbi:MAG: hypothetical protein ACJAT7_003400 [Psychromonas sp.]|jgi:hypothetical protein|uniref:DUF6484 domain-containing protein n=1 Tax=Psychromonas sp. TaxID=1884585 RepID=UPI0039E3206F